VPESPSLARSIDEAVEWLARDVPFLAVAGAGLSIPGPACAPSVPLVLQTTIEVLSESAAPLLGPGGLGDLGFRERLLPESCYGAIASSVGKAEHLRLWESYGWVGATVGAPRPNAGHHVLIERAARYGTPVLTTNFDLFLESAAVAQGLEPLVCLPRAGGSFGAEAASAGQVAVWKLHGTAEKASSLRSQPADLVRSSYSALRRVIGPDVARLLIVGYSGRDFDVFPSLRALAEGRETLWVDLTFGSAHRAHTLPGCLKCEASFEEVARRFTAGRDTAHRRAFSGFELDSDPSTQDAVRAEFRDRVREAVRRCVDDVVEHDPERARLALAVTLNTAADFPQVVSLVRAAGGLVAADPRTLLALHFALDSMDRFRSAEVVARMALRRALAARNALLLGRAELAGCYSRLRRFYSTFTDPQVRSAYDGGRRTLFGFMRAAFDAALFLPLFVYARVLISRGGESLRRYDALAFASEYVEHLIRVAAATRRIIVRLPRPVAAVIDRRMWAGLRKTAQRVGYMRGVLNTAKYQARLDQSLDAIFGSQVVGDLVASAIAARDAALHCLAAADDVGLDAHAREELLVQAEAYLWESIEDAWKCGNPTLILKDLLILRDHGFDVPLPGSDIADLCRSLEGEADRAAIDFLTSTLAT